MAGKKKPAELNEQLRRALLAFPCPVCGRKLRVPSFELPPHNGPDKKQCNGSRRILAFEPGNLFTVAPEEAARRGSPQREAARRFRRMFDPEVIERKMRASGHIRTSTSHIGTTPSKYRSGKTVSGGLPQ